MNHASTVSTLIPKQPLIVGLGGSMRQPSSSLQALEVALEGVVEAGARAELIDVRLIDLPLFGTEGEAVPPRAEEFAAMVSSADGMIWSSPLYHGTVSATFKNALDWLQLLASGEPPYLTDKAVGLIATAGGTHALQAINTMDFVVRALRGLTVPLVVPIVRAYQAFDDLGQPRDSALADQLHGLGREVVEKSRLLNYRSAFEAPRRVERKTS